MEVQQNNSILFLNNHFNKIYKKLIDKKRKNEAVTAEIDWINSQLVSENRDICRNACDVLVQYGNSYDTGFSMNALISAYSRLKNGNFDIIADGIFSLLMSSMDKNSECPFGIVNKKHPAIVFIDENTSKMLYLSKKIEEISEYSKSYTSKFLQPLLLTILCSNETIYAESSTIWRTIIDHEDLVQKIISLRRVTSPASCRLYNSMLLEKFKESKSIDNLLLLLSSIKYLAENSIDPSRNLEIIMKNHEILFADPNCINIVLFIIAEILQISSIKFIPKVLNLLKTLVISMRLGHPVILYMILDGLIQILAYPSINPNNLQKVEELVNYIGCGDLHQQVFGSTKDFKSDIVTFDKNLSNAFDACGFIEDNLKYKFDNLVLDSKNQQVNSFWTRNHLILRGYLHSNQLKYTDYQKWNLILLNLIEISKSDEILKNSLVMPLLFELSQSFNPKIKVTILQNLTELGASTEIFSTIKALSSGMLRSMAITLHLKLWMKEPRIYPFLHKYLVETSSNDSDDVNLNVIRAATIKRICDLKPHHGPDLVTILSEILNQALETKTGEVAASLAIDAITILCQNHIISIMSTWKAINLTTRYEKRERVVKSLCKFFAAVPQFRRNNLEYETFAKDIISRIFYMIQWGDIWSIKCALDAFKSWNYETLTLDMIPDVYRENIALPDAPKGMEVSILDLEVPGDCYVQLLCKVNPYALESAGELITHFIRQEISEYRSGHYIVKEGQAEPVNYKNLPKQSIVKALTHFVIQQATTKKAEKIVDETILVEALNILSQKYSRPLMPLNWTFLHELIHKGEEVRAKCMAIAGKQAVISGTAKRLIENFLINIDENSHVDIKIALDILVDLCNGTSGDILKLFFDRLSTCYSDDENLCEKILILLTHEKDVTNRENLAIIVSAFINRKSSSSSSVSCNIVRAIPPNILNVIQQTTENKIKFRCEILKQNAHVENSVAWFNELVVEQLIKNEHRDLLSMSFVELLLETKCFPMKKWLNEFIILVQNKTVEKETIDVDGLKFLLDLFVAALVAMSGYFVVDSTQQVYRNRYRYFAQSLQLYSSRDSNDDIIGNIFEFVIYMLNQPTLMDEFRSVFKNSIILCKNHCYFKKSKTWNNFLEIMLR